MRVNAGLMRQDDVSIIPSYKKVIRKKTDSRSNGLVLSLPKRLKYIRINKQSEIDEEVPEVPMDKWIMPPEPQRYLKYPDHDFL